MLRLMQSSRPPEFIHLLNPDAVIEPGAVSKLLALLQSRPRVAAAGSQLLECDGRLAGSAFRFPTIAREFLRGSNTAALGRLLGIAETVIESDRAIPAEWVTGASVMFRTEALRETGLFDDGFFLYFEEIELMWRLRRSGWDIWYEPGSRVRHIGGAATGIASGGEAARAPRPGYWFQSRRRLFALLYGANRARLAGLAWLLGNLFWRLRRAIGSGNPDRDVPGERKALLAHGLSPDARDLTPAVVAWDSPPGQPPAWSASE
jgi:GT2 family glycosyltransferase